jgi:hypothetical protein
MTELDEAPKGLYLGEYHHLGNHNAKGGVLLGRGLFADAGSSFARICRKSGATCLRQFDTGAWFAKAFDEQPGLNDEFDPPAQRPVEPGNAERLRLFAFLQRHIRQPKRYRSSHQSHRRSRRSRSLSR